MNKSLLVGLIGGIGIATAGGVAGYALMSKPAAIETGSAEVEMVAEESVAAEAEAAPAIAPAPAPTQVARAAEPAPQRTTVARATPAAAPAPAPAAAPAPEPVQECWDEEVEVQAAPRDERAIAGTATGALLGGALAKKLGDDNDLVTAAGAAAGAFAGRRLQRRVQENNTETVIERRCAPAQ